MLKYIFAVILMLQSQQVLQFKMRSDILCIATAIEYYLLGYWVSLDTPQCNWLDLLQRLKLVTQ